MPECLLCVWLVCLNLFPIPPLIDRENSTIYHSNHILLKSANLHVGITPSGMELRVINDVDVSTEIMCVGLRIEVDGEANGVYIRLSGSTESSSGFE